MALKIGDKVRHKTSNIEGKLVYSQFGASVSWIEVDENGRKKHFQTLGQPIEVYETEWKWVDSFKHNMKGYEAN